MFEAFVSVTSPPANELEERQLEPLFHAIGPWNGSHVVFIIISAEKCSLLEISLSWVSPQFRVLCFVRRFDLY